MANIVDKYFTRKKKQLYDYCKMINEFLVYNDDQIWKSSSEFNELVKSTINEYIDNYYFKPMDNFENYNEYLGELVKCDNRFKTILVCSQKNLSNELKTNNYKVSLYIISLIVYTSVVLNRFTYPYNNYKISVKNVSSIIDPMFKNVSFITYKYSSKVNKELTYLIKKNDGLESRFFNSLNELNSEESKNIYECIDKNKKFYKIIYKYHIEGLDTYRDKDVEKYMKRITGDLNTISYELSTTCALKSRMRGSDITLLFPIKLDFYEKESEINKLFRVTSNGGIKDIIKFYIEYDDFKNHMGIIRILSNAGFKMALNYKDNRELPYGTFNEIKTATIENEFLEINKSNIESWKNNGVEFIIKENNEPISELEMLGLKEEN